MREGYSITFSVCVYVSVTDFEDGFISPNGKCDALLKNVPILENKS